MKNFFKKKKIQIKISPEVYHKIPKFSILGLYFDQLYPFLNSIHQKMTLVGLYQIFVTRVTKKGATVIRKNEGATVKISIVEFAKTRSKDPFMERFNKRATHVITQIEYGSEVYIELIHRGLKFSCNVFLHYLKRQCQSLKPIFLEVSKYLLNYWQV